jgi:hypothetical protein
MPFHRFAQRIRGHRPGAVISSYFPKTVSTNLHCTGPNTNRKAFSSQAGGDDLGSMNVDELRSLVKELRSKASSTQPHTLTITEVPEGYLRPTKGESSELKNITIVELQRLRDKGIPITMV